MCTSILAVAELGLGDLHQAGQHVGEALRAADCFELRLYALPAAALFLTHQGQQERAVEMYALASRHPHVANSQWFEDVFGHHIEAVAATLPPDVVAAARERGRRVRDLDATVAELLQELG